MSQRRHLIVLPTVFLAIDVKDGTYDIDVIVPGIFTNKVEYDAAVSRIIGYVVGAAYHLDIIASAFNNRELLNSWCHETVCALVSLVNFFQTTDIDTCTGIGISQVCTVLHHYTGSDERSVILSYHRINSAMLAIYKLIAFGIHQVALNIIAATNSRIIQDRLAIFACLFVSKITTHIMITDFICYRLVCIAESWICFL